MQNQRIYIAISLIIAGLLVMNFFIVGCGEEKSPVAPDAREQTIAARKRTLGRERGYQLKQAETQKRRARFYRKRQAIQTAKSRKSEQLFMAPIPPPESRGVVKADLINNEGKIVGWVIANNAAIGELIVNVYLDFTSAQLIYVHVTDILAQETVMGIIAPGMHNTQVKMKSCTDISVLVQVQDSPWIIPPITLKAS